MGHGSAQRHLQRRREVARHCLLPHQALHLRGLGPAARVRPDCQPRPGTVKRSPPPQPTAINLTILFIVSVAYLMPSIYPSLPLRYMQTLQRDQQKKKKKKKKKSTCVDTTA